MILVTPTTNYNVGHKGKRHRTIDDAVELGVQMHEPIFVQ
jgi:hypothetical protein